MYSLVSPSVLCMDLIRHENALGVIDVLDRALVLNLDDVPGLAAVHHEDEGRTCAWAEVDAICKDVPKMSDVVAAVRERIAQNGLEGLAGHGLGEQLARTPLFGLSHLLSMVRDDVLDWTWDRAGDLAVQRHPEASAVVLDAVAAMYARDRLSVAAYARLGTPWVRLHREVPLALPGDDSLGPHSGQLRELVDRMARFGEDDFARLDDASTAARSVGHNWAATMHAATWATYLSGRLRQATRAQLAATRALVLAGIRPAANVGGVMRVVTAVVQALIVADVLDTGNYQALLAPWEAAYGAIG